MLAATIFALEYAGEPFLVATINTIEIKNVREYSFSVTYFL